MKKLLQIFLIIAGFLLTNSAFSQSKFYVKPSGTGNGSSWNEASGDIQAMINQAAAGDEIWVAAGTYTPSDLPGATGTLGARDVSFVLKSGVKLYGGFSGTETTLEQRNHESNITILSGDIGTTGQNSDNAYHVVVSIKNTSATLVDGFVITNGHANDPGFVTVDGINVGKQSGGGVFAYSSQTVFKNVNIEKNVCAGGDDFFGNGGGVYAGVSQLTFEDSRIAENASERVPGKSGGTSGALFAFGTESSRASLDMKNVTIEKNSAMNLGGAMYIIGYTDVNFEDVHFIENEAQGAGGAIRIDGASATDYNNFNMQGGSFVGNSAVGTAGAAYIWSFTNYTFNRVNFSGNEATSAGGALFLFSGGAFAAPNDKAYISNSVFYNNIANGASLGGGAIFVSNGTQVQITNSTFYSNYAKFDGGAIGVFSNAVVKADIHNSIFSNNTTDGSNPDFYVGALAALNLSHTITQKQGTDGVDGVKVNADPQFASVDPAATDFFLRLLEASPAVNTGDNDKIAAGVTTDLAGGDRIVDEIVDMGAYEFFDAGGPTLTQTISFEEDVVKTYGDDSFTPVATASSGLPVSFAVSDENVAIVENNTVIIKGAGTATIHAIQAGSFEYLPADTVSKTITVNKADLIIRAADTSMVQGDPLPNFRLVYSGFVYGENEEILLSQPTVTTTATSSSDEGDYPITVSGASSDNYNIIYEEGKLTVSITYAEGMLRFVKPVATGTGSGLSWENASDDLQAMIDASSVGGEVWVAAGTYIPTSLPGLAESPDGRYVSFVLKSGVGVYGGFAGNETKRSDRNISANETILSGDAGIANNNTDNAYHVVLSLQNIGNTILDGFTIKDGHAGGSGSYTVNGITVLHNSGAGVYVQESHGLSLFNLKITGNNITEAGQGAGLYMLSSTLLLQNSEITENNISGSTAMGGGFFSLGAVNAINSFKFSNVKINNNTSQRTAGGGYIRYYSIAEMEDVEMDGNSGTEGAGIHTVGQADFQNVIKITKSVIKNHAASGNGGAMLVAQYTTLEIYESEFSNNSGGSQGGAIYITGNAARFNKLIIDKSRFIGNKLNNATSNGGAIRNANYVEGWITNSVFIGNESNTGAAISFVGSNLAPTENTVVNSVFYNNKSRATSGNSGGGAINTGVYMTLNVINSTFYNNETGNNAGAVQIAENNFTFVNIYNSIFYGNKAAAGDDINWPNTNAKVELKNNLTQVAGVENEDGMIIGVDPVFESVDPESPNFLRLSILSPAFNKGNNELLPPGTTEDQAGNNRIVYNIVDMGAYEYAGPPLNPVDPQTITFSGDITKTYGDALFDPGATASSGLPVSYIISNQNVARVGSNNMIQLVGGGVTQISAFQPGNAQYIPSDTITVTLTVNKASLVIKPADVQMEQGSDLPIFAAEYTGFVYNDNASSLTVPPIITTTATDASPVGSYPLTASGAQSDKYEISYQPGVLSIIEPPRFPAEKNNLTTWFSSGTELQVSVDMVADQSGTIVVYTNAGVPVYSANVQLRMGTNRFTIPADRILPGVYIVNVRGNGFKLDKKIIKR